MSKAQLQVNNTKLSELITTLQGKDLGGNSKPEKKAFAECTWTEVSEICKAGLASEYWQIGDTKNMIDGDTTTALRIIGFDHDYVSDVTAYGREKAGITLEMAAVTANLLSPLNSTHTTSVSWDNCNMRTTILPNYFNNTVPEALRNVIIPVGKEFVYFNNNSISSISDTLFLLSTNEIFGTYTSGYGRGGTQYAYYAAGNSKIKGGAWWTRSPYDSTYWTYIDESGGLQSHYLMKNNVYATPCFCI